MTRTWTPEQEAYLAEIYADLPNDEVAKLMNERFGTRRTRSSVMQHARHLGLGKSPDFVKPQPRKLWTPEKEAWFREFVPGHHEHEISAEHERLYGTPLSAGQIGNAKTKLGVRSGTHGGRFQKGCAGGFSSEEHRRKFIEAGRATRFKQGEVHGYAAKMTRPVWTERVNKDGYVEVKMSEGLQERPNSNFRLKHHLVYEQAYGSIPRGCNIVFADRDKSNFDPENLVAVPRRLWTIIQRRLNYWDAESLRTAMLVAELDSARHAAQCRPRECRRCGAEFKPRFANQRTCDACLNR